MALVIFNGVQYDDSRLPPHVNPREAVSIERWRKDNRRVKTRPRMTADTQTQTEPPPAGDKPVTDMTKDELVAYVEANKLDVDTKQNKPELLAAVQAVTAG